ncbi:hypothetical protein LIER_11284 [Lithospermum erythrorhizon]|uniref:Uncharacterized protein n=1 Tax=Lithospermum erythrorhizon TaxID=34254 RepID=A0AAV3PNX1_LITER
MREGHAIGVPYIWTLTEEAKGLPIPSAKDVDSVGKLRGVLPQGDNKQPWYTFCDEAMLVAASLVYDKVFSSEDKGKPPTWGIDFYTAVSFVLSEILYFNIFFSIAYEITAMAASTKPQLVDFNVMMMDHPSLFTRVAITTKTKPSESMVPEATSTSPHLPSAIVPTPSINPMLKRMKAKKYFPSKKKTSQVLDRDSLEEETQSLEAQPATGTIAPSPTRVVNLDSSTTVSDHDLARQGDVVVGPTCLQEEFNAPFPLRSSIPSTKKFALEEETRKTKVKAIRKDKVEASTLASPLLKYSRRYLETPYEVPNLEVTSDALWEDPKFHFHLARSLLSKNMGAQYTHLVDPYVAFAQSMKHITQRTIAFKNSLNLGLDKECTAQKEKLEGQTKRVDELIEELTKERDAAKAWSAEKIQLKAERDNLRAAKLSLQVCDEELKRAKIDEANKAFDALA